MKKLRPRFRFSVRLLLAMVTIVASAIALHAHRLRIGKEQRDTVSALKASRKSGGFAGVIYEYAPDPTGQFKGEKWYPKSLENLLGIDYLYKIDQVSIVDSPDPTEAVTIASRLRTLNTLKLTSCSVKSGCLDRLVGGVRFKRLEPVSELSK